MESATDLINRLSRESAERIRQAEAEALMSSQAFVLGRFEEYIDNYFAAQQANLERIDEQYGHGGPITN